MHTTAWESARETGTTADMPYELVLLQAYDSVLARLDRAER